MNKRKFNVRFYASGFVDIKVIAENHVEAEEKAFHEATSGSHEVDIDDCEMLSWSDLGAIPLEKDPNQTELFEEENFENNNKRD